jgi:hypothetical protein
VTISAVAISGPTPGTVINRLALGIVARELAYPPVVALQPLLE